MSRVTGSAATPGLSTLEAASPGLVRQVLGLPGVRGVLPYPGAWSRWFDGPPAALCIDEAGSRAVVVIGADRHHPVGATVGLVEAYVRARLGERGIDSVEVEVRVAVLR